MANTRGGISGILKGYGGIIFLVILPLIAQNKNLRLQYYRGRKAYTSLDFEQSELSDYQNNLAAAKLSEGDGGYDDTEDVVDTTTRALPSYRRSSILRLGKSDAIDGSGSRDTSSATKSHTATTISASSYVGKINKSKPNPATTAVVPPSTKDTPSANNLSSVDRPLILWVPYDTQEFDTDFLVSTTDMVTKYAMWTEIKQHEIRKCVLPTKNGRKTQKTAESNRNTTIITATNKGIDNHNLLIPECPTSSSSFINNITQDDKEILILCYKNNSTDKEYEESKNNTTKSWKKMMIEPNQIVGITTDEVASSNFSPLSGGSKLMKYRNKLAFIGVGDCPEKCRQEDYKFDGMDRLCKSTKPPIPSYGGSCGWKSTCFTPEVTKTNTTWPWPSLDIKHEFYDPSSEEWQLDQSLMRGWVKKRNVQRYQMRFLCPGSSDNNGDENSSAAASTIPTASVPRRRLPSTTNNNNVDSTLLPELAYAASQHHLLFFPQAKMIFCGIPKGGITEWAKFLRYTMGAGDYLSFPHQKRDRTEHFMSRLSRRKASELLLSDPSWTLAVFFRDPAERLLSAYFDKIVNNGFTQGVFNIKNGTDGFFKNTTRNGQTSNYVLGFREFVDLVTYINTDDMNDPRGLSGLVDPHWKPQSMMCGMDYLLPHVDFVGNFKYVAEHTKALLERVGLWEEYGSKFDPGDDVTLKDTKYRYSGVPPPSLLRDINVTFTPTGFNQKGPTSTTGHRTSSKNKMDEYFTPELLEKVRTAYKHDYAIWDDIADRAVDDVLSGKDLNVVQTYCK